MPAEKTLQLARSELSVPLLITRMRLGNFQAMPLQKFPGFLEIPRINKSNSENDSLDTVYD